MSPPLTPQRLAWLTLRRARGEPITYTDGDLVINLVAVATRPDARQLDAGENFTAKSLDLDWLIAPDELVDETGDPVTPAHRAKITRANGETYRCMPTDSSEDTWRWSDPQQTWMRVHTSKS